MGTLAICTGFCTRRYRVQVSTEPVVSWPATSMDSRSSRSCRASTASRVAFRPSGQTTGLHFITLIYIGARTLAICIGF